MQLADALVSPKQVARAIGVSESSLKRWCDQGLIATVRTAGGHRKMAAAEVLRFVRERDQPLIAPRLLGLPPASDRAESGLAQGASRFVEAILDGDALLAQQIVFNVYLAKHSIAAICDEVLAKAFHEIGDRWSCREADVYQERRGCEICLRILYELSRVQPAPAMNWTAIGGTFEGDPYALPAAMCALVVRGSGFHATSLGISIPVESWLRAVRKLRPNVFWLTVSHIARERDFLAQFALLSQACAAEGTALVVGGRALTADLRKQMIYASHGDTMQQLESFAQSLFRALQRPERQRSERQQSKSRLSSKLQPTTLKSDRTAKL